MVALSHPRLRPESGAREIRKYSQHYVDVIDLEENAFKTMPVRDILRTDYPGIRLLASWDKGDYLQSIYATGMRDTPLVLTFDELMKNQEFVNLMRGVLQKLERHYGRPVDMEFTVEITQERPPHFILHLLQCRPQSWREGGIGIHVPTEEAPPEDVIFLARRMVPHGRVNNIRYIVYVRPEKYYHAPDRTTQLELARLIGRLNSRLEDETFILMGPGRWGTSNIDLGLKVTYADIYNSSALIEIAQSGDEDTIEVSYGTHFFQDLVESEIYPLPLYLNSPDTVFNRAFFEETPNALDELLSDDAQFADYVKVIDVPAVTGGRQLDLAMDSTEDEAMAYLR
jgi:hypothetical protein